MRQLIHRYILPSYFLILHAILIVPLLLPDKTNPLQPEIPLNKRLNAEYAVPLGLLLYLGVALFRSIAGHFPLPHSPNRSILAARLEWVILFGVGLVEEILRYVVVRILVEMVGGEGGFGGIRAPLDEVRDTWTLPQSIEVKSGIWESVYLMSWTWSFLELPAAWWRLRPDAVHRDEVLSSSHASNTTPRTSKRHKKNRSLDNTDYASRNNTIVAEPDLEEGNSQSTSKRLSSVTAVNYSSVDDSVLAPSSPESPLLNRESSPEWRRTTRQEEGEDAGDEDTSATDNGFSDNETRSYFYRRPLLRVGVSRENIYNPADFDDDDCDRTPTQQEGFRSQLPVYANNDLTSDDDDTLPARGRVSLSKRHSLPHSFRRVTPQNNTFLSATNTSDSEASPGPRRRTPGRPHSTTPLLSSTMPDENSFTSYHVSNQTRPLSQSERVSSYFSRHDNTLHISQHNRSASFRSSRPNMTPRSSYQSIQTGNEAEDELEASTTPRLYPSFPTYGATYNHTHFPTSQRTNSTMTLLKARSIGKLTRPKHTPSSSSRTIHSARSSRRLRSNSSYVNHLPPPLRVPQSTSFASSLDLSQLRYVNGIDVQSMSAILPILWRAIAAMQHIGYGLWYAWLPSLVFAGRIQWWSVGALLILGVLRGVSFAEWTLGKISARSLQWPATLLCLLWTFLLYLVILIVWGALW